MSVPSWLALGCGALLGTGLVLIMLVVWTGGSPSLVQRVQPQLRGFAPATAPVTARPSGVLGTIYRLAAPLLGRGARLLDMMNLDSDQLQRKLWSAGLEMTVAQYRTEQLMYALLGASAGMVVSIGLAVNYSLTPLLGVIVVLGLGVLGFFLRDNVLSSQVSRRKARILAEFPTVTELVALSVSAGDTAQGAIERVANSAEGELATEFDRVMRDLHAGSSFATALRSCDHRVQIPAVERFISGLLVALERGTPLSQVLRAQAHDVREMSKRNLMEVAGKKEIGMMAPLIFGILPLTVLFAVYPGLSLLNLGV
ncbi:type II secretion system protein F [Auritidibacter sp. NML120779]|nr:type II secretion system protein F [Auritidibacter sp. NML120779]